MVEGAYVVDEKEDAQTVITLFPPSPRTMTLAPAQNLVVCEL